MEMGFENCMMSAMASPTDAELKERFKNPEPWFSKSSIEYLETVVTPEDRVLELGGGVSTLWWLRRTEFVLTVEANTRWLSQLVHAVATRPELLAKWSLLYVPSEWPITHERPKAYWKEHAHHMDAKKAKRLGELYNFMDYPFEPSIIVIDGAVREQSVISTREYIQSKNVRMVVVDNMDGMTKYLPGTFNNYDRQDFHETDRSRFPSENQEEYFTSVFTRL